jgi:hypothetical protein
MHTQETALIKAMDTIMGIDDASRLTVQDVLNSWDAGAWNTETCMYELADLLGNRNAARRVLSNHNPIRYAKGLD